MIVIYEEDGEVLDDDADELAATIQIDDTLELDRAFIQQEYDRAINTIKKHKLEKQSFRIMGETVQYHQAEGAERLAAKVAVSLQRAYPWLNQP